jgi:hypothetical protein
VIKITEFEEGTWMEKNYRENERLKSISLIQDTALFNRAKGGRNIKHKGNKLF